MTLFINHGHINVEDALNIIRPYFKNNMAAVVLKALTILDCFLLNCGKETRELIAKTRWPKRLSNLMQYPDNQVKTAVLQLIANLKYHYK